MKDCTITVLIQTKSGKKPKVFDSIEQMTAFLLSTDNILGLELASLEVSSLDLSNLNIKILSIADCLNLVELSYSDNVSELELLGCPKLQARISENIDRLIIRASRDAAMQQPTAFPPNLEILELGFLSWLAPLELPAGLKELHVEGMSAPIVNLPPSLQRLNLWDWEGYSLPNFPETLIDLGLWDCPNLKLTAQQAEQQKNTDGIS